MFDTYNLFGTHVIVLWLLPVLFIWNSFLYCYSLKT